MQPPPPLPVEEPREPTELELIESEMREISPRLRDLKHNNHEEYEKVYRHYLQLVERRSQLLQGNQ
jgi:hypothetical protein